MPLVLNCLFFYSLQQTGANPLATIIRINGNRLNHLVAARLSAILHVSFIHPVFNIFKTRINDWTDDKANELIGVACCQKRIGKLIDPRLILSSSPSFGLVKAKSFDVQEGWQVLGINGSNFNHGKLLS